MKSKQEDIFRNISTNFGFIGLGEMGARIVQNLLSKRVSVLAFDIDEEKKKKFSDKKFQFVTSPSELVQKVSVIFLCLPFSPQIEDVLFGKNGIIYGVKQNTVIIDMSTINSKDAINFSLRLKEYNIDYCDCPISGLPQRALEGTLTIMFGGNKKKYKQILPILELIGNYIIYCGKCGSGQIMKTFNNVLYNINIAALSEIISLASAVGLEPDALEKVFKSGSSSSFASTHFIPKMLRRKFTGDYSLNAGLKDITNVKNAITDIPGDKPLLDGMIGIYNKAIKKGLGEKSKGALLQIYEQEFNVKVKYKTRNISGK